MKNRTTLLLLLILLAGLSLRLAGLGARSFWFDEVQTALPSVQPADEVASLAMEQERKIPLYHLFMHFWLKVSRGEFWGRLPSVIFGVLTIWLTYLFVREFTARDGGERAAWLPLLAAGMVALSPVLVWRSQELRMYSCLAAVSMFSAFAFAKFAGRAASGRRGAAAWAAVWVVAGAAGCAVHPFFVLLAAGQAAAAVVLLWRRPKWALLAMALAIAGGAPGGVFLLSQAADVQEIFGYFHAPELQDIFNLFRHMSIAFPIPHAPSWHVVAVVGVGAVLFGTAFVAAVFKPGRDDLREVCFMCVIVPLGILVFFSLVVRPMLNPRFLVHTFPFFLVLAAIGVMQGRSRVMRIVWVCLIAVLSVVSLCYYYFDRDYAGTDTRGVARYLEEEAGDERVIIHSSYKTYFPSIYYNRGRLDERLLAGLLLPLYQGRPMLERVGRSVLIVEEAVEPGDVCYLVIPVETEHWMQGTDPDVRLRELVPLDFVLDGEPKRFFGAVVYRLRRVNIPEVGN